MTKKTTKTRATSGVRRRVIFQAWCSREHTNLADWAGPERDLQGLAAFDVARHTMDAHGGTQRGDDA